MTFTFCSLIGLAIIYCLLDDKEADRNTKKGSKIYVRDHNNLFSGKTYEIDNK